VPEFRSLHFTSCRAGEGLLGGAGLQFRAVSPGVDPATMEVVERHCLYEPPHGWMVQRRPVPAYPRSLAHIFDGRFATASGVYLGTEATGTRRGNHFTHALVTDDIDSYGQLRPAQLWGSPVWLIRWDGGTVCPPLPREPESGVLDPLWLQSWVAEQPNGEEHLVAVLSALQAVRAGGPRVLFLTSDPKPVLAWLAAATILMPRADALRIGFKVFVANADYSAHDVVAVHPDWGSAYRGAPTGSGFVVFDLDSGARSTVTLSATAQFWVHHFLRRDCFDVLDAVELSGALQTPEPSHEGVERIIAATLVLGEPLAPADVDDVVDWLGTTSGMLSERLLTTTVGSLLQGRLQPGQLDRLHRIATGVVGTSTGDLITWQIFARALSDATSRAVSVPSGVPEATFAMEGVLVTAEPEMVLALLSLASRYGLRPAPSHFTDSLHGFVRWWADTAWDLPEIDSWSCRDETIDLLRDELERRVQSALSSASMAEIGNLWWRRLLPTIRDPRSPLDTALITAALLCGDKFVQQWITQTVLSALRDSGGFDAMEVAWKVLHRDRPPAVVELPAILALATPDGGLPPAIVPTIEDILVSESRPHSDVLRVLDRLTELGYQPGHLLLQKWQQQTTQVQALAMQMRSWSAEADAVSQAVVDDVAAEIEAFPVEVLTGTVNVLVDAMRGLHPNVAAALMLTVPAEQCDVLVGRLAAVLSTDTDERTVATAFLVFTGLDRESDQLRRRLVEHRQRLSDAENHQMAKFLDDYERSQWWALGTKQTFRRPRNPFRKRPR